MSSWRRAFDGERDGTREIEIAGENEGERDERAARRATSRANAAKGELRVERLLDELTTVDRGKGEVSNRAKFRALPIDAQIMGRIRRVDVTATAKAAGRTTRALRNRDEINDVNARYAMYDLEGLDLKYQTLLGLGRMKRTCKFIAAAAREGEEPPTHAVGKGASKIKDDIPEIAFAGRSNVGKSSLINALTLSAAARSSDVPGKTQSLNFYSLDERIRLVDLPGYGFAFADQQRVDSWNDLMDKYLTSRKNLKRVYVVVDARHGLKAPDREMIAFLSQYGETTFQVILNKCDSVNPNDLARRAYLIQEELRYTKRAKVTVMMASTSTGAGITEIAKEVYANALEDAFAEEIADDEYESEGEYKEWGGKSGGVARNDDDVGGGDGGGKTKEFYGGEWKPGALPTKYKPAPTPLGQGLGGGRGGRGGRSRSS